MPSICCANTSARGSGAACLAQWHAAWSKEGNTSFLAWVLSRNPSWRFYEAVGGELLGSQEIEIGGARLEEVAYGWLDIESVASLG